MKHLFVPYELAKLAKEKGFDELCIAYWNGEEPYVLGREYSQPVKDCFKYRNTYLSLKDNDIVIPNEEEWIDTPDTIRKKRGVIVSAPLYQQLVDWFREKHELHIDIRNNFESNGYFFYI